MFVTHPTLTVLSTSSPKEMPDSLPLSIHTDNHVHTRYCRHASGEMEEYVLQAIAAGLRKIVFLEHMEAGVRYFERTWLTEEDFDLYFSLGQSLQRKYKGQITIALGVEVGYSPSHRSELLERLAKRNWDRIGVSYHFMEHPDPGKNHLNLLSRKSVNHDAIAAAGPDIVLAKYLQSLKEAITTLPGTVLCHLDAPLRHFPGHHLDERYIKEIQDILKIVKRQGMELEINTSGFKTRGTPYPAPFIIEEAIKLGIPLAPGSDAHRPQDVGREFVKLEDPSDWYLLTKSG